MYIQNIQGQSEPEREREGRNVLITVLSVSLPTSLCLCAKYAGLSENMDWNLPRYSKVRPDWQNHVTSLLLVLLIVVLVGVNTSLSVSTYQHPHTTLCLRKTHSLVLTDADKWLEAWTEYFSGPGPGASARHRFCFLPPIIPVVIVD